jgi:hypothetical protein
VFTKWAFYHFFCSFFFFFLLVLEFELRASCLLGRLILHLYRSCEGDVTGHWMGMRFLKCLPMCVQPLILRRGEFGVRNEDFRSILPAGLYLEQLEPRLGVSGTQSRVSSWCWQGDLGEQEEAMWEQRQLIRLALRCRREVSHLHYPAVGVTQCLPC